MAESRPYQKESIDAGILGTGNFKYTAAAAVKNIVVLFDVTEIAGKYMIAYQRH
jgi:hypothetical protein